MFAYVRFHTKPNEIVVVSAECDLQVGSNRYSFILGDTEMVCAPGTIFNLTECTCVADENPDAQYRKYTGQLCCHLLHISVERKGEIYENVQLSISLSTACQIASNHVD